MTPEQLQEFVTKTTRDEIIRQVNKPAQMNESVGLALVGAGILTAVLASAITNYKSNKIYNKFIEKHLKNYDAEISHILRKFKFVSTMSDIDQIEKDAEAHLKKLESLYPIIDEIQAAEKAGQGVRNALRSTVTAITKDRLKELVGSLRRGFSAELIKQRQVLDSK